MRLSQHNFYHLSWEELFGKVKALFPSSVYDYKKHAVLVKNDTDEALGTLRLPLHLQLNSELKVIHEEQVVIYLAIESGNAALHVWEGERNAFHTTFSAYMNRKKQGFSQVKYLNKKGKSRAGSRLRLKGTALFFDQINECLNQLFEEYSIDRIAISCGATLWPYLFKADVGCPFDKKDERLYKIPLHLPQSNHTNLTAAVKKLKAPVLFFDEDKKSFFINLLDTF